MSRLTTIPFGPQHPVLPEPIHLDLITQDEKVVEAVPSIGFIHRGLEKLVEKKDFLDLVSGRGKRVRAAARTRKASPKEAAKPSKARKKVPSKKRGKKK